MSNQCTASCMACVDDLIGRPAMQMLAIATPRYCGCVEHMELEQIELLAAMTDVVVQL
jgi:hypothetical protein